MRIEDRFTVSLPVAEAWGILLDLERIAPCMPGAELQEVVGDDYRGIVKVKLGAITAQFKGTARFTAVDEAQRRVVLRAEGREVRGQGNAAATVTASLAEADGGGTEVTIESDLSITGRVAQFGRGVLADVSSKLLGDFARCLEADLAAASAPRAGVASEAMDTADAQPLPAASDVPPEPAAPPAGPGRAVRSRPAEPVDLLAVAGPSVAQRVVPAGLVAVLLLLAVTKGTAKRWALALVGSGLVAAIAKAPRRTA